MSLLNRPGGAPVEQLARDGIAGTDLLYVAKPLLDDVEQPSIGRLGIDRKFLPHGRKREHGIELAEEHVEHRLERARIGTEIGALEPEDLVLERKMRRGLGRLVERLPLDPGGRPAHVSSGWAPSLRRRT